MENRMKWEQLLSDTTQVERESEPEEFAKYPMNDLEKDYKAIISSAAFRRLQDKTQVFPLDKSDFVRTRLTHSLDDLICNLPFTRLAPSDFRSGTPQLFPHCPLG